MSHPTIGPRRATRAKLATGLAALVAAGFAPGARGQDPSTLVGVSELYRTGRYEECSKAVAAEIGGPGYRAEPWYRVKVEADRARGDLQAASTTVEEGLRRFPASATLRLLARSVYVDLGKPDEAAASMAILERLIEAAPQRFNTAEGRVALGRYFLLRGADAKQVLDRFYDVALKQDPKLVEAYLASAELALSKQDNALAAATLSKAPEEAEADPRYHALLARALMDDDRAKARAEVDEALKINPRHVDALLLKADALADSEAYDDAARVLSSVIDVNPIEPRAWAYRAVLAHLRNDPGGEASSRDKALSTRPDNPEVPHIIGRELSRKYRFAEGSNYQRQALAIDPEYAPAQAQLCEDLLRLGNEEDGWKLADAIFAADPYNVQAFNLVNLRDRIGQFTTLKGDGILLRMDAREADLYGDRALALLARARKVLGEKYDVAIPEAVTVEIFPQKKEFAVRTFGLPGAEGFLGVCFGAVITANSPASQGEHPTNWESVLWHEYCHAVTLHKTLNKMPRWLSEGISVYEEEQANPAWRSGDDPRYRAMLLGDELTPLSKLSSAFLAPKSGLHLQFAYHESALAVAFLVGRAGLPAMKNLLEDLGRGETINDALVKRCGASLDKLDADFEAFAHARAKAIAPEATWDDSELPADSPSLALANWLRDHPKSYPGWKRLAVRLLVEKKYAEARSAIDEMATIYPDDPGSNSPHQLRALLARQTGDLAAERKALVDLARLDGSASDVLIRLGEIDRDAGRWPELLDDARKLLAVNPLILAPHRWLAEAAEKLGDRAEAVRGLRACALLDDADPASVRYRLAKLLAEMGRKDEARRQVVRALEDAPRYRDAHKLLLELVGPPGHEHDHGHGPDAKPGPGADAKP